MFGSKFDLKHLIHLIKVGPQTSLGNLCCQSIVICFIALFRAYVKFHVCFWGWFINSASVPRRTYNNQTESFWNLSNFLRIIFFIFKLVPETDLLIYTIASTQHPKALFLEFIKFSKDSWFSSASASKGWGLQCVTFDREPGDPKPPYSTTCIHEADNPG